jgi:hypothetical protein
VAKLDFRILAPLEVRDGERPLTLGGAKHRAVLTLLLVNGGQVVSSDRLIEELWPKNRNEAINPIIRDWWGVKLDRRCLLGMGADPLRYWRLLFRMGQFKQRARLRAAPRHAQDAHDAAEVVGTLPRRPQGRCSCLLR